MLQQYTRQKARRRVDFTDVGVPSTIAGTVGKSKQKGANHITLAVRKQPEAGPQFALLFLIQFKYPAMDGMGTCMQCKSSCLK